MGDSFGGGFGGFFGGGDDTDTDTDTTTDTTTDTGDDDGGFLDAASDFFGGLGFRTREQQAADRGGVAALGEGGSKGARTLTEREVQKGVFEQVEQNPQTFQDLQDRVRDRPSGSITGQELEDLGLEARQTTLGIVLDAPTTYTDVSRIVGSTVLGEEYSIRAEAFLAGTQQQRAAVARGLTRGTLRASDPDAPTAVERSTIGRLGEVASGALGLQGLVSGVSGLIAAAGLATNTQIAAVGAQNLGLNLPSVTDVIDLFDEESTLVEGGFLSPLDRSSLPSPATGEGDGGVTQPFYGDAQTPETTAGTPPVLPIETGTPPRPRRGFRSTVRTGFFGRDFNVRRVR